MNKEIDTSPQRLAKKLTSIRKHLKLSQSEMLNRLGFGERLFRSNISQYERGDREPPLLVLLQYARMIGSTTDVLIDDDLELHFSGKDKSAESK